jgi:CubicO group peptidase (beta-lactamase class C family)
MASRNHIGELPREAKDAGWRFGLLSAVLDDPAAAQTPLSRGALDWGGAWGHRWFVDRTAGISAVVLSNTAWEGVSGAYPKEIYRAIYGAKA